MTRFKLEVLLEGDPATGWVARSPAVGIWSRIPAVGAPVADAGAGILARAGRRFELTLPAGTAGRVAQVQAAGRRELDVEWGQELFRIGAVGDVSGVDGPRADETGTASGNVLVAPSDGVFYTRPTPDAAPFATVGSAIRCGQPVGLIEVMKTFNHVLFEGDGLPETAVVGEYLVADGEAVTAGSAILRFEL